MQSQIGNFLKSFFAYFIALPVTKIKGLFKESSSFITVSLITPGLSVIVLSKSVIIAETSSSFIFSRHQSVFALIKLL